MRIRAAALATLFIAGFGGGCRSEKAPAPRASAARSAVPKKASSVSVRPPAPPMGCRVLSVTAKAAGAPSVEVPKVGDLMDGRAFVDLGEGVDVSLKHSETRREFVLNGPGRFRVCARGEEAVVVGRGSVSTTAGPGARAGAEVHIGTPFGVVHFGDAALKVTVSTTRATLHVAQGSASVGGATPDDKGQLPSTIEGPNGRAELGGRRDAKVLVAECESALAALSPGVRPVASAVPSATGSASAGPRLGQWAVQKLRARQQGRYSCMRAQAAVAGVEGPEADRLWDLIAAKMRTLGREAPPDASAPPIPEAPP